jgi:hypothetical protein
MVSPESAGTTVLRPSSCRDGHALDANELQILFRPAIDFQLYGFADVLCDLVKRPPLRRLRRTNPKGA